MEFVGVPVAMDNALETWLKTKGLGNIRDDILHQIAEGIRQIVKEQRQAATERAVEMVQEQCCCEIHREGQVCTYCEIAQKIRGSDDAKDKTS